MQLWVDNVAAKKCLNKGTTNSPRARVLLRILALLTRGSPVSLNAEFVPGVENVAADALSRSADVFRYKPVSRVPCIFSNFPQMHVFDLYQPSPSLLSAIWYVLLEGKFPPVFFKNSKHSMASNAAFLGSFVAIDVWDHRICPNIRPQLAVVSSFCICTFCNKAIH